MDRGGFNQEHADFRVRAKRFLERVLTRDLPSKDVELVRNTNSDL